MNKSRNLTDAGIVNMAKGLEPFDEQIKKLNRFAGIVNMAKWTRTIR